MSETLAPVLGEATVQELRDALRGELLQPGDEQYDEAKRLWNGAHDGSEPAIVARCTGAADVIAALGFARANDLEVAVRGGGHSVAGLSTSDGGMVIDLSPMRNVRVDPDARVSRTSAPEPSGATSTTRPSSSASPRPAGSSRPPASRASRSAAASGG